MKESRSFRAKEAFAPLAAPPAMRWLSGFLRAWAAALATTLATAAVFVLWRRAAGALARPLDAAPLAALGALAVAALLSLRRPGVPAAPRWLAAASAGVLALAVSLPGTPLLGLVALWGPLLAAGVGMLSPPGRRLGRRRGTQAESAGATTLDVPPSALEKNRDTPWQPPAPAEWTQEATQHLIRFATGEGETLTARLRADFVVGQRTASLHVAFCPPFRQTPTLTARQVGGTPCKLKTLLVLPYGARIDARLARPAEKTELAIVDILARSTPG